MGSHFKAKTKTMACVLIVLCLLFSCYNNTPVNKEDLYSFDFRLFMDTPAWELAKAIDERKEKNIRKIVAQNQSLLETKETRFGQTLLMLTVKIADYKMTKLLLELGANPNVHDSFDGASPIIIAGRTIGYFNDNPDILALLLEHGANPNDIEVGERRKGNTRRRTPLLNAVSSGSLEKVKLLIEAGADIDYMNEFSGPAVFSAITQDKMEVLYYLLNQGANFNITLGDNKEKTVCYELRKCIYKLGSENHTYKLKVIRFLQERGVDYNQTPIPDYVIKRIKERYPNDWERYLSEY